MKSKLRNSRIMGLKLILKHTMIQIVYKGAEKRYQNQLIFTTVTLLHSMQYASLQKPKPQLDYNFCMFRLSLFLSLLHFLCFVFKFRSNKFKAQSSIVKVKICQMYVLIYSSIDPKYNITFTTNLRL
jgi:hypothetical protein